MFDKDLQQTIRDTEQDILQNNNPDILSCIANLSNDEVFTPPHIAMAMLDILPADLWTNPHAKFLDPCSKTGVFLREIVKRLDEGLLDIIPDGQQRINHILQHQVFAIGITELTALLTRRTVYCSKTANGQNSLATIFTDVDGNVRFNHMQHTWANNGKCIYCGVLQAQFARADGFETHAYPFIHTKTPQDLFTDGKGNKMKFDVIIGNPPYQISDGGAQASAKPIYQKFIQQAQKLNPRYLSMIIPARWYTAGKGLDSFRRDMIHDKRVRVLVDYPKAQEVFPKEGADFEGGVCYFLWDRDNKGDCLIKTIDNGQVVSEMTRPLKMGGRDVFIRDYTAVGILQKITDKVGDGAYFDSIVSPLKPFGLRTYFRGKQTKTEKNNIKIHTTQQSHGYININDIDRNQHWVPSYKVYISRSYGERGEIPAWVTGKPFLGRPNTCCSETYLVIGAGSDKQTAENIRDYMKTKFFRFCVSVLKSTQDATQKVYKFAPLMDFTQKWTDQALYKHFDLTQAQITHIEKMIKPMEIYDE